MKDELGITKINHDELGRTTQIIDYNGRVVKYLWKVGNVRDCLIHPDGKEIKYVYDDYLRLKKLVTEEKETYYYYDEYSRLIKKQYPEGLCTQYSYDNFNRIKWFSHMTPEKILDTYTFAYDIRGNKIAVEKNRDGLSEESKREGRYLYKYDELNRLQEACWCYVKN